MVRDNEGASAELEQELPADAGLSVREIVRTGLAPLQALLDRFEQLSRHGKGAQDTAELHSLQARIDLADAWNLEQRVESIMSELALPADRTLGELSGGWRRRVGLARAIVARPDLLLLEHDPILTSARATVNRRKSGRLSFGTIRGCFQLNKFIYSSCQYHS